MAKTTKKALGTAMAGVMAVGAIAGAVSTVQEVKAGVAEDVQLVNAKIEHLRKSLKTNYLGVKNIPTWQQYEKDIQTLINKLPEGSSKDKYQDRLDVASSLLKAVYKVNHTEKSLQTKEEGGYGNYQGIKNAETWNTYLAEGKELLGEVDKEFTTQKETLTERLAAAKVKVDVIIEKHNTDLADATKLYDAAVVSNKLEDAQKALDAAKKLGTHSTSAELIAKIEALIAKINEKPAVQSVSGINSTQVEVVFNKAVTKETAEASTVNSITVSNLLKYTVGSANPTEVSLSEDKKTATLTFASSVEGNAKTVVVEPFTTVDDQTKETAKYTSLLTFKDTVKPTVSKVTAQTGTATVGSLTVKFSEPVATGTTFKVNGTTVASSNVGALTSNDTQVTLSGLALKPGSTNTLEVIALTDKATEANVTVSQLVNFTAEANTAAPKATITTVSDKYIDVTFDKKMNDTTFASANVILADEVGASVTATTIGLHPDDNGNKTKFRVELPDLYTAKDSRTLTLSLTNAITDSLGNKLAPVAKTVAISKDEVKPTVSSPQFVKNSDGYVTKIILNYSEELAAKAAVASGSFAAEGIQVVDVNGRVNTTVLSGADIKVVTVGDKKVEINVPAANKVTSGAYNIVLPKDFVTDNAHGANKSAAQTVSVNFGISTEAFVIPVANITSTPGSNVIQVNFDQAVKGGAAAGSATDRNNYKLDGKVLPEGTSIVLNTAGTIATITLPASNAVKVTGATPFAVEGVQNAAGIKNTTVATTVSVKDNTAPVLTKITFDSYDAVTPGSEVATFTLEFDEAVKGYLAATSAAGELSLKVDGQDVSLSSATVEVQSVTGFDNKYTLTIKKVAIDTVKPVTITTVSKSSSPVITDVEGNDKEGKIALTVTK